MKYDYYWKIWTKKKIFYTQKYLQMHVKTEKKTIYILPIVVKTCLRKLDNI